MPIAQADLVLEQPAAYRDVATHGAGRAWLADWLAGQVPSDRIIDHLFVGRDGAAATILVHDLSTAALVGMEMGPSGIALQATLRWRDAHPSGATIDARLDWVDELVSTYLTTWSTHDNTALEELYAEDAVVDLGSGDPIAGRSEILDATAALLPNGRVAEVSPGGRRGPAVFVFPSPKTRDVVIVVESKADGCSAQFAIRLRLDEDGRITTENRLPALATIRSCHLERMETDGWWTDLAVPPPLEEQVSGVVDRPDGGQVTIINGSSELERLLTWGLDRFAVAGLNEPRIDSITFAPVPACADRAGVVTNDNAGAPDLVLCTDTQDACTPGLDSCSEFRVSTRFGLLHELSHVWLLNNLDKEAQTAFMEYSGTSQWRTADLPWHQRGVEHAAETISWGLMDESVALVRLDNQPCHRTTTGFHLLTGTEPLRSCAG